MKDTFYFPHDSNAKDDPKCIMLIEELGLEGYGIFWVLLELLRDQPGYRAPIVMIPAIARRYNSSAEKFKSVILRYGLFQVADDEFFFSESFNNRMLSIDERRRIASESGKKGMLKRWGSYNDLNNVVITSKVKESKVKESKVKESKVNESKEEENDVETKVSTRSTFKKPEFDEVLKFFIEKGYQAEAENFYSYFQSNGWYVGKVKMKSWPDAATNWMKRSDQFKTKHSNGKPYITEVLRNY